MHGVVRSCKDHDASVTVVTAGYADYRRIDGLSPAQLVEIARRSGSDMVMLDTFIKDGKNLMDALSEQEIRDFVSEAQGFGLRVALAGSVRAEHMPFLASTGVDVVGVRGAVCSSNDRSTSINPTKCREFLAVVAALATKPEAVAA
jgi:uncharacterized protein (UPF0264 family)